MEFEPAIAKTGIISVKTWIQRNGAERAVLYPSALKTKVFILLRPFIKGLDIPLHSIKSIEQKRRWGEYAIKITYEKMGKEKRATLIFSWLSGGATEGNAFYQAIQNAMPKKRH